MKTQYTALIFLLVYKNKLSNNSLYTSSEKNCYAISIKD